MFILFCHFERELFEEELLELELLLDVLLLEALLFGELLFVVLLFVEVLLADFEGRPGDAFFVAGEDFVVAFVQFLEFCCLVIFIITSLSQLYYVHVKNEYSKK